MRRVSRTAVAGAATASLAPSLSACGGAKAVYSQAKSVEDGKPRTGIVGGDLKTGQVGPANSHPGFADDTELQEAIETAKEKIIGGEITVKTS